MFTLLLSLLGLLISGNDDYKEEKSRDPMKNKRFPESLYYLTSHPPQQIDYRP
jgi:hypothetical protein